LCTPDPICFSDERNDEHPVASSATAQTATASVAM